jgi:hypothetical protein
VPVLQLQPVPHRAHPTVHVWLFPAGNAKTKRHGNKVAGFQGFRFAAAAVAAPARACISFCKNSREKAEEVAGRLQAVWWCEKHTHREVYTITKLCGGKKTPFIRERTTKITK